MQRFKILFLLVCCCISHPVLCWQHKFNRYGMYTFLPLTNEGVNKLQLWHDTYPMEPNPENGFIFMKQPTLRLKIDVLVPPRMKHTMRHLLSNTSEANIELLKYVPNFSKNIKEFDRSLKDSHHHRRVRHRRATDGLTLPHQTYLRYSEALESMEQLKRKCNSLKPDTCSTEEIGQTYEGRKLMILKISLSIPNKQKRKVWIDGGIHAREWISPATVLYVADTLISKGLIPGLSASMEQLVKNYDFMILPLYNPDGYEYAHTHFRYWRKNREPNPGKFLCTGVDLNRNYGFKFGGYGASKDPCQDNFHGPHAFSARENNAVKQFIQREHNQNSGSFILFLSYHSYGQYILLPYGYKVRTYPPDKIHFKMKCVAYHAAQEMYSKNHRFYIHGTSADVLYQASGGSDDWAHGEMKIPYTMTVELPDDGAYGFLLPPAYIQNVGYESVFGVVTMLRSIYDLEHNSDFYERNCPKFH